MDGVVDKQRRRRARQRDAAMTRTSASRRVPMEASVQRGHDSRRRSRCAARLDAHADVAAASSGARRCSRPATSCTSTRPTRTHGSTWRGRAISHVHDGVGWQFWNGTTWTTSAAQMQADEVPDVQRRHRPGTAHRMQIDPYGSGFLASTKRCDLFCDDLTAWFSPSLAVRGVWSTRTAARSRTPAPQRTRRLRRSPRSSTRTGFIGDLEREPRQRLDGEVRRTARVPARSRNLPPADAAR